MTNNLMPLENERYFLSRVFIVVLTCLLFSTASSIAQAQAVQSTPDESICIAIDSVLVTGSTLVSAQRIDTVTSRFEGKCVGLAQLNTILEKITFLYVDSGFITSRAYLPEQDLSDGSLEIVVVEGKLSNIIVNKEPERHKGVINSAFPKLTGKPLNLRDIEQGLDQINRLPSKNAKINLEPATEAGGSNLAVSIDKGKPWTFKFGIDNLGSKSSGEFQTKLDVTLDDLFGINDQWTMSYQRTMSNHPFYFSDTRPNGDTFSAGVTIPYGNWTFGANGSIGQTHTEIVGNVVRLNSSSKSQSLNLSASRLVHRDQASKTKISAELNWKNSENYILGSLVEVSSRKLTVAKIGISHETQFMGGQLSAAANYFQGISAFGAFDDDTAAVGSPKGQFKKISGTLNYARPFNLGAGNVVYNGSLTGQWSGDLLFGSEQMSLGGYSTVRGISSSVLFGNNAMLLRNDVSLQLPRFANQNLAKVLGRIEPYVGLDVGHVFAQSQYNIAGGTLVGATIGVKSSQGALNFDFSYADLLSAPQTLAATKAQPGVLYARMSVSF